MKITKYLHSCLLVQEKQTRLLIDPGTFVFADKLVTLDQIPPVSAIVITHVHGDHCDVKAIKELVRISPGVEIFSNSEVVSSLGHEGVHVAVLNEGDTIRIGSFSVVALRGAHEAIEPDVACDNIALMINGRLLHPGDSQHVDIAHAEILALPVAAPWTRRTEAWAYAKKLALKHVIPIHDGFLKDYFRAANDAKFTAWVREWGGTYHALAPGESFEV
ncbi:MAG: MBL fold metallo-hydrolase [Patescibacteria group bacterium]